MENAAAISSLSIIGSAGRGDDFARLDRAVYDRMADVARTTFVRLGAKALVSGGAAWADHLAVRLALEGLVDPSLLTLHLPAPFNGQAFDEAVKDGNTSNYYHRRFSQKTGVKSLEEIAAVIAAGATVTRSPGFFARNMLVAKSDAILAYTYGGGKPWSIRAGGPTTTARQAGLKDGGTAFHLSSPGPAKPQQSSAEQFGLKPGGTAHTWNASRARVRIHVCLG